MMVHYLIYLSSATSLFTEEMLESILESSRRNNSRKGITGILLYHDGAILQVLEGEKADLDQLYTRLESDPRHQSVIKVMEGDAANAYFPDWSMGFRRLSSKQWADVEGYLPVNKDMFTTAKENNQDERQPMLTFLQSFYQANFNSR